MSSQLESASEANRLYWESELSVSDISERLNLSRRALYDVLDPLPTGLPCAACGGGLVYENRSARTAGEMICGQCGARPGIDAAATPAPPLVETPSIDPRTFQLGGAMIAGAIVGVVATLMAVSRR